jgi:hypothetical protein
MKNAERALYTDDYNNQETLVYIKNYDIDSDIGMTLWGSETDITYVYWNNIPNEEYLSYSISNAYWTFDDTF